MKTHKYNFNKLRICEGAAGSLEVVCKITGRRERWNQAVIEGWYADLNGEPFNAYYSPESISKIQYTQETPSQG